ncbi:SHOCT domain-containing protein [Halobacillus sp. BAB-2008]|uniref:SHOCT domain-containing protein n=1 Tax=Halobacillus sp. BAB-2008 TaxID=1246484 RepID=UPI0002A4ED64|nr:SHOCT domain-containing protein [Halobacillus sp. BAB-2008]ELK47524.1 hypothetical protein D479_06268 [Halobacillus sp. BAB-2008]
MWGVLGVIAVFLIMFLIVYSIREAEKKEQLDQELASFIESKNMELTQKFETKDHSIVAVDENKQVVYFLIPSANPVKSVGDYELFQLDYQDIMEAEVKIDGETITKTSRGSQLAGAALGGLLAGGAGAVIGGLSGGTKSSDKVQSVQLHVVINNTQHPFHSFEFLKIPDVKKKEAQYKLAFDKVMHWQSLFKVIIGIADKKDKETIADLQHADSLADELRKMHELFSDGIISQEEYDVQRKRMLN